jgi:apolipoprotein N-acyltransferase
VFDRWFDSYRWWWCALSGLLLVACFAPFSCATCGWIALVPAWWIITRSEKARRQPIRHGYLIGLIYYGGLFWWIGNVTAIGAFFLVLYLALYPGIWFLFVARLIARRTDDFSIAVLLQALAAASLWVMLEWWRAWFLTGFNWNELGISQAPSIVFRQLAAFGGVHLISFLLVTVNVLWAEGLLGMAKNLRDKRVVRPSVPFAVALAIVAGCFVLGWLHIQSIQTARRGPLLSFACIQPNIPQIPYEGGDIKKFRMSEDDALDTAEKLSATALLGRDPQITKKYYALGWSTKQPPVITKPDLLIWPEAFTGEEIFRNNEMNRVVHEIASSSDRYFLVGAQDSNVQPLKFYNCAYLFGPGWDSYQYYRKTRLVILGEYLPIQSDWLREKIGIGMDMTPGPGPKLFTMDLRGMEGPGVSFTPFICFEDTLSEVADKAARLKPDFFITITNDGWYTGWCAAWGVRQHLNNAVFRCVEHDRPMIRCANTGISCIIDQNGTVTDRYRGESGAEIDVGGVFARTLFAYESHTTVYEIWGDWIVLISSLVSVMLGVRFFLVRRAAVKLRFPTRLPI